MHSNSADRATSLASLRQAEAQTAEITDMVDAVTIAMSDGLWVIDATGKVLKSNPAAARMAGIVADSRLKAPTTHGVFRLDGSPLPPSEGPLGRALRGELVPDTDVLRIDPKTGQQTILSMSAAPLRAVTPNGASIAVVVSRDVTKVRAANRELENFAGVVAHDLKAPLAVVISWAEILEEQINAATPVDAPSLRSSISRIRSAGARMERLISDLLVYTQAQNAELNLQSVSLDDMVEQIAQDQRDQHREAVPVVEHPVLGRVMADPTLVRQLLTNLIGNAVKYVAPGVVPHIVLASAAVDDMLEIWISDNGIGILDTDLGRVFDSFFRGSSTHDYPGTGLGLAICARNVERHGGRISARNGLDGQGTTMIFTLPLDPAAPVAGDQPDLEPISTTS
jgi:signal transduction histidine kinase